MRCHKVDYKIIGHDIQMVEIWLDPGAAVIAETGAMTYLEQDFSLKQKRPCRFRGTLSRFRNFP